MPWWPVENTIVAAGLALIVALVCRIRSVPPVVRHALWLVVLLKLIVPPLFPGPIQVPAPWRSFASRRNGILLLCDAATARPGDSQSHTATNQALGLPNHQAAPVDIGEDALGDARRPVEDRFEPLLEQSVLAVPVPPPATEIAPRDAPSENTVHESNLRDDQTSTVKPTGMPDVPGSAAPPHPGERQRADDKWQISASSLLIAGFLVATFGIISIQFVRLLRLRRLLTRARPAPDGFVATVEDLAAQIGIRAPVVGCSAEVSSPIVCTFGRPVLLWPASQLAGLRETALRAVILHELAHLARRDHLIGWLELAAGCFWWWNPLFWYVRHQLRETAELACDAWVMALYPEGRGDYARALVDLAEFDSRNRRAIPALGVADGSKHLFQRRLVMIMGSRVRYRLGVLGVIGTGLLALAAMPGCSAGHAAEEPALESNTLTQPFDVDPADDPFSESGLSAAIAAGPTDPNALDPAETAPAAGLKVPSDLAVPIRPIEPPAPTASDTAHPAKTLTVKIAPPSEGLTPVMVGNVKMRMRPNDESHLRVFERRVREELGESGVHYDRIVVLVDKRTDFSELQKLIDVCKAEQAAVDQPVTISLVASSALQSNSQEPPAPSSEDRLKRLEGRFDALLKELHDTKSIRSSGKQAPPPSDGQKVPSSDTSTQGSKSPAHKLSKQETAANKVARGIALPSQKQGEKPGTHKESDVETVELTRAIYKLPPGKAQALASFLSENLTDEIDVRVKVSGEAIQVTATREDQAAIAQLIRLLQTRGSVAPKTSADDFNRASTTPEGTRPADAEDAFKRSRKGPATGF